MKTIALCFSTPGINTGDWRSKDYGKRYPGAGFMRHLDFAMSGHEAVEAIRGGHVKPEDVHIVQEELNPIGLLLQGMGAKRTVLTCLESPIFASSFYDQQDIEKAKFKHSILFAGGTEHLYFPSFDREDIRDPVPWNDRKFLCAVVSNKHYSRLDQRLGESPSFQWAMKTQLHNYRYAAIEHFLGKEGFDLYGRGWGQEIPECTNKLDTIRNYKFALCFENGSYPGYITEKIIDCLVAGVVPIYMGATDISDYIPSWAYIPANSECIKSFEDMERELNLIDKGYFDYKIKGGREWLLSSEGQKYSNESFAKRILELCE